MCNVSSSDKASALFPWIFILGDDFYANLYPATSSIYRYSLACFREEVRASYFGAHIPVSIGVVYLQRGGVAAVNINSRVRLLSLFCYH